MRLSVCLISAVCVSSVMAVAIDPQVYNTTLRESLYHGNGKEINSTADRLFEKLLNPTFLSKVESAIRRVFRHHNLPVNETVLVNGTKITRAQLETEFNRAMDEPYVHNTTEASTVSSPAVQEFYTSLSKRDRKTFAEQLENQQWLTESELEAYLDYPTTRAWGDCAVSSP